MSVNATIVPTVPSARTSTPDHAEASSALGERPGGTMSGTARPTWDETDIAIIGMAGRFPGAWTPDELWANVAAGVESVRPLSDDELRRAGVDAVTLADPRYVKAAATMAGVDLFDAGFFGFSPRDAAILDPQHRHFLESAWEALEDAGYDPARFPGAIGVYAGCGMNGYFMFNLLTNPTLVSEVGLFLLRHTGNDKDFLPTRVSYLLGLTGPSLGIQTACSTSLVAVHVACQQLLNRECDMALAGGVTIELPHGVGYRHVEGEILSPDGRCRAFDAGANGTVFGSGSGVVVLRRRAEAMDAGDHVYAVIKGSAVNNDGAGKVSYFAPSVDGQAAAIREALSVSGVAAARIGYIEAHGTGTPVGDPIEVAALTQALSSSPLPRGAIAIGSLKSNIGHLDTAAGVAGLIKTAKALQHRQVPPSLHFRELNPAIDRTATPFKVPTALTPWPAPPDGPRAAAVNSLGVGGTNAHVVVEEAPTPAPRAPSDAHEVLVVSARTPAALDAAAERLARHLERSVEQPLADVAFTLQAGRRAFPWRRAVAAASAAEAAAKLRDPGALGVVSGDASTTRGVAYLFPGGGAQYVGMGRDLFERVPVFRDALTTCADLLDADGFPGLLDVMFPASEGPEAADRLSAPLPSVLSVVATEYAMTRLLDSWGVTPSVLLGHSLGEYMAAHLAGVLSLRDTLALARCRGEIFAKTARGGMVSVALSEDALTRRLPAGVSIAACNGPELTVASGPEAALAELEARLTAEDLDWQRVRIDVAAHSAVLDLFLPEFRAALARVSLSPPRIPVVSGLTGELAGAEMATADYWVRHLREPVRFVDSVRQAAAGGARAFLEVGPGRALSSFVAQSGAGAPAVPSMRHPRDPGSDVTAALAALGGLWAHGVPIDWTRQHRGRDLRRVSLPTYPFERSRHWIEPGRVAAPATGATRLARAERVADWFWRPVWREQSVTGDSVAGARRIVCVAHADGRSDPFVSALRAAGHRVEVLVVGGGEGLGAVDWRAAVDRMCGGDDPPSVIVADVFDAAHAFDPVLALAQAVGHADLDAGVALCVLTRDLFAVDDMAPAGDPRQALAVGPLSVLAREYPGVRSMILDVEAAPSHDTVARVVEDLGTTPSATVVAVRGGRRWVRDFEPVNLGERLVSPEARGAASAVSSTGGLCLITGAFGGLGRLVAQWTARQRGGRLALLARQRPDDADAFLETVRAAGAEPMIVEADLSDGAALRHALDDVRARVGPIDTVLHLAGRLDDEPLATKTPVRAAAVLAPKVAGTLNLAAALDAAPPATLLLFSSTSAFLGLPGQADYAAANAFLAAFADSAPGRRLGARAIHWGAWRQIGMTSRARLAVPGVAPSLLGQTMAAGPGGWTFEAVHSDTQWWYDEHRTTRGTALLPGTAYLELLHAAGRAITCGGSVHLTDVAFVRPLELLAGETRRVVTRAEPRGQRWHLTVTSESGEAGGPTTHAEATLATDVAAAPPVDLAGLERRCDRHVIDGTSAMADQSRHIRFGPRWQALRRVKLGGTESVASIRLTAEAGRDLETMVVHPALLDLSIVAGVGLVPGQQMGGLMVPFSVASVRVIRPVSGDALAVHARLRDGSSAELGRLDLTVTDPAGRPFYVVEDLAVRRLDGSALSRSAPAAAPSPAAVLVEQGITAAEGLQALGAVLDAGTDHRVLVASPFAPHDLVDAVDHWWPPSAPIVRPEARRRVGDDLEADIAAIWSELLGVDQVDLDRDFFAIGGHSLLGVRLVARIEKRLGHRLELSTLFTARTVRSQAQAIRAGDTPRWPTLVPLSPEGTRPPFFLVHAVDGQVLSFMELAQALGPDQPVYGFKSVGFDGRRAPLRTVRAQAELYVADLLDRQPEGPHYLGGHSHGGRVVFEMARVLEARGTPPALVAIIDAWTSDHVARGPGWPLRFLANLPRWMWHDLRLSTRAQNRDRLRRGVRRIAKVATRVLGRRAGVEVGDHMDVRALPDATRLVFEANFEAFHTYAPARYGGRVTVFRATAQPLLTPHLADHGWRQHAAEVDVVALPGNHISIMEPPRVQELARAIRAEMDVRLRPAGFGETGVRLRAGDLDETTRS